MDIERKRQESYKLAPAEKQVLIDQIAAKIQQRGFGTLRSGEQHTEFLHMRSVLHEHLKQHFPGENADALFATAADIMAISLRQAGTKKNTLGLPDDFNDLVESAWQRINNEKRYKESQLCSVIRAFLFDGENAAEKVAIDIAKTEASVIDSGFLTKGEKDDVKRNAERLLKDARELVRHAIQFGVTLDLSPYPLDKDTAYLVRYYGEAAKLIREGRENELKERMAAKATKFVKWEGAALVTEMLLKGAPAIPEYSTSSAPAVPQSAVQDDPWL